MYSNSDSSSDEDVLRGRRNIRKVLDKNKLQQETRLAKSKEEDRKNRIENRNKQLDTFLKENCNSDDAAKKLILDFDPVTKRETVSVHQSLCCKMKDHQRKGVKFMWDNCYESVNQTLKSAGSGCILAHCMGLGKTFQVVALTHTILTHAQLNQKTVLICCPKSTVVNWVNEFKMWIKPECGQLNVFNLTTAPTQKQRLQMVCNWQSSGGVCVMNYDLLRILSGEESKNIPAGIKKRFQQYLCNPGPDLVVCDEGHVLRNEGTRLSKVMNSVKTLRRIVLTGTPMQNNLKEYHCMVHFVKPNLLGSKKEFLNMFVNPILNGQYENSLPSDVKLMKERSFVLHKTLAACIQRYDYETLVPYLPPKHEYVISLRLSEWQKQLCQYYLDYYSARSFTNVSLFADYQAMQRIWSHPYTLNMYQNKFEEMLKVDKLKKKKKKMEEFSDDEADLYSSEEERHDVNKTPLSWWTGVVSLHDAKKIKSSTKFRILFELLKQCEENDEKLLVFSNSLYTLNTIEYFLKKINDNNVYDDEVLCDMSSSWIAEQDYFILTGRTSAEDRARYCKEFNDENNPRARLFLISTRAGGLGITLVGANRAVIFDASWNPSYDIQSIFRLYRLGQKKECYVYRFLAAGCMEEKIYERQVIKQSISHRVVDEKQIARHYTANELQELYKFEPDKVYDDLPTNTQDPVLNDILLKFNNLIGKIHEHDSLLEHKKDEELHEIEKTGAWTAYNYIQSAETLSQEELDLIETIPVDDINLQCLKEVLIHQYPDAEEDEIIKMSMDVLPELIQIQMRPDIKELMMKEALYSRNKKLKNIDLTMSFDELKENISGASSWNKPSTSGYRGNSGRKGVLSSWGQRGGYSYGSPDFDELF